MGHEQSVGGGGGGGGGGGCVAVGRAGPAPSAARSHQSDGSRVRAR